MFRCGVTLKNGEILTNNCPSKDECEEWLLGLMDKHELKKSIIVNKADIKERWIETF